MTGRAPASSPAGPRLAAVLVLVLLLVPAGTGLAHALWTASATTTATVTGGVLGTAVAGTQGLTAENIATAGHTRPVPVTLHNTGDEPLGLSLAIATDDVTLDPARIELVLWKRTDATCPGTVPATGTVTGTLAAPPALPAGAQSAGGASATVVCAATRFTGTVFGSAGQSLTAAPSLIGRLAGTNWSATAHGATFTQTMAPAPAPVTGLTCANRDVLNLLGLVVGGNGIRLSWYTVPDATGYQVRSATGQVLADTATAAADLGQGVDPGASVQVAAVGPTGYSAAVSHPVHRNPLLGLRCGSAP
ncbi:hypothetical protein ACH9EU_11390 [Kocuria sp. M1R5S2]|uniref:hypothetical protein n=1 Tax=Kocuria rhizosphaerae TaxID=3376285 RepID=UPI0037B0DA17